MSELSERIDAMARTRWAWRHSKSAPRAAVYLAAGALLVGGVLLVNLYVHAITTPYPGNVLLWIVAAVCTVIGLLASWAIFGPVRAPVDDPAIADKHSHQRL